MILQKRNLTRNECEELASVAAANLDALWESSEDYGIWVRQEDVPTMADYNYQLASEWFDGLVSERRLKQLKKGAKPTIKEINAFQDQWVEKQLFEGGDADEISGYAITSIQDGKLSGTALILRIGYSFSEIKHGWKVFSAHRKKQCNTCIEDDGLVNSIYRVEKTCISALTLVSTSF